MAQVGKVKWFSDAKGYGFIEQPGGEDGETPDALAAGGFLFGLSRWCTMNS